jgi:hypothetical protein
MTKTTIKQGVQLNISGTKRDIKITPKYPLESVRWPLETKGTQNPKHMHIKPSFLRKLFGG